jgi:hypothetical protein
MAAEVILRLESVILVVPLLWMVWKAFLQSSIVPDLPIAGYDNKEWFAWPKLLFRATLNFREIHAEAYKKVTWFDCLECDLF